MKTHDLSIESDSKMSRVIDLTGRVAEKIGIFLPCLFLPVNYQ